MKKQIFIAMMLSFLFCLPVFGGEDKILGARGNTLTEMASGADKEDGQRISVTLEEENRSVVVEEHYTALKEAVNLLANEDTLRLTLPKNRWGISLTPAEFDLLTRIVMLEAGGESIMGQQAVTEVILNRMISPYYGGSLEYVLSAKGQFSTWSMRYSSQAAPTPQVIASVNSVLEGQTNILPFQTLYFSRKAQNSHVQIRIGRHVFCNQ